MIKEHYEVIRKNKMSFWWFSGRRDLFVRLLKNNLQSPVASGIDLGCGPGTNEDLYFLLAKKWLALDNSKESFKDCKKVKGQLSLVGELLKLPVKNATQEICLLLDVLEHIDEEQRALSEIHRILKEDGLVLISVPAFKCLWSYHDEQAGHKRRYRKKELEEKVKNGGFELIYSCYFNFFLFLPILFIRKIMRITSTGKSTLEADLSPRFLDRILFLLLKMENFINLNLFKMPFGTSVVMLLRKK